MGDRDCFQQSRVMSPLTNPGSCHPSSPLKEQTYSHTQSEALPQEAKRGPLETADMPFCTQLSLINNAFLSLEAPGACMCLFHSTLPEAKQEVTEQTHGTGQGDAWQPVLGLRG